MKKYILRTNYDCLIECENKECLLDSNSSLTFDQPEKLLIKPINSKKNIPPFTLDLGSKVKSENFTTIPYKDSEIVFINSANKISTTFFESIEFEKKDCHITICQESISFRFENTQKTASLHDSFKNYSISQKQKVVAVHLIGENEQLWIFSPLSQKLTFLSGEKIQLIENQIILNQKTNDFANSQTFKTFEIVDDRIVEQKSKISYSLSTPQKATNPLLIPIAFLESVKSGDFENAKKYLSNQLQNQASEEHLVEYFGKFINIIPLEDGEFALTFADKVCIYHFTIENQKICEIDILEEGH